MLVLQSCLPKVLLGAVRVAKLLDLLDLDIDLKRNTQAGTTEANQENS